jgi:hypothetical protein
VLAHGEHSIASMVLWNGKRFTVGDIQVNEQLYNKINTLLSHLRQFNVISHVGAHYEQYANQAPPSLLKSAMDDLQQELIKRERNTL